MKRSELKKLTRRELYSMAKAYDIAGRSKMAKEDLVEVLARVSARRVMPKPKPPKRRMAKRRKRRTVKVRTRPAAKRKPSSPSLVRQPQAPEPTDGRQPAAYVDRGPELSQEYGLDKIVAMVRDPNWLYTYWDLSGGARERLSHQAAGGAWVLRVRDLDTDSFEDVPVLLEGGNWYVPVRCDTEYQVDIGVLDAEGVFHLAASSRKVKTPPMGISDRVDEDWMVLEEEFRRLLDLSDTLTARFAGSHFISEIIARRRGLAAMHSAGVSSFSGSRRR